KVGYFGQSRPPSDLVPLSGECWTTRQDRFSIPQTRGSAVRAPERRQRDETKDVARGGGHWNGALDGGRRLFEQQDAQLQQFVGSEHRWQGRKGGRVPNGPRGLRLHRGVRSDRRVPEHRVRTL